MVNLVAMPVSRGTMEKYQDRHVRQIEHAAKQLEAKANKVSNANNRRKWLERQDNANYRNEYDKESGANSRVTKYHSKHPIDYLRGRMI